jgi:hypothetical protein
MKLVRLGILSFVLLTPWGIGRALAAEWQGFAGNPQHTAQSSAAAQSLARFHWTAPVDLHPVISRPARTTRGGGGGQLLIHYGSPMITTANTTIFPVKERKAGNFDVQARNSQTGAVVWQLATGYVLPPHNWTPEFPAHLTGQNKLVFADGGGIVGLREDPDSATGKRDRLYFYGKSAYEAAPSTYNANVMIDTPISADNAGNLFFGFTVLGSVPNGLKSGIARIDADGTGTWVAASTAADDTSITNVAMNCAPAVSNDGSTIYIAVSNGSSGYLLGLDSKTLATKYKAALIDPSSGEPAWIDSDSSASPTVAPDGDVYYGVLENPFPDHDDRGWLLHFDSTLATVKTPGSFGWDNTVSVVPATAVSSYKGSSPYLLMTKYNNYYGIGPHGDGHNRIAILDPKAKQMDEYSTVIVMKEVITQLGPTQFPGEPTGSVYEWCIDSAVVDPIGGDVIANSEDGHVYRWDLATNTLSEVLLLNAPRSEAYTPTIVGPDGTVYAINNATLYAIGN